MANRMIALRLTVQLPATSRYQIVDCDRSDSRTTNAIAHSPSVIGASVSLVPYYYYNIIITKAFEGFVALVIPFC